jgi:hypothetical protein
MIKHVGRHNNRKIVLLYREVPNERHMCLLVYSDSLSRLLHDALMKCLESTIGQNEEVLANVLHRTLLPDGRNALEVLHKEGFMKKVQTAQVIMTPSSNNTIRLDELNNLLDEMAKGEDAIKRLSELDASSGLGTRKSRDVGEAMKSTIEPPLQAPPNSVLMDSDIAKQQMAQAARMRRESLSLLAEADRLEKEAVKLDPTVLEQVNNNEVSIKNVTAKKAKKVEV